MGLAAFNRARARQAAEHKARVIAQEVKPQPVKLVESEKTIEVKKVKSKSKKKGK